jgi:transposase
VTEGAGPIVIDDSVSSLDRDRGLKVAARIAAEAQKRQVIVFTHDLIFFNDLCREADDLGVATETIALFADGANAGKVDPAGVSWKGLSVNKRLARIRNDGGFPAHRNHQGVDMSQKSVALKSSSERIVKDIRRATRKQYSAEEKIRIVLDGLRGEHSIAELCRREGIAERLYYTWSKEFLEAGKRRLAGDTARAATTDEVKNLRQEARALKEVVAEQALELRLLKKSMIADGDAEE